MTGPIPARAAAVDLVRPHMALAAGSNQAAVTRFPSGVAAVYFDYTIRTPVADEAGEVAVYAGGTSGTPLARAPVILRIPAALSATLRPASGAWPDGGYCTVLLAGGEPDSANGAMPIGWVAGTGAVPHACAPRLRFDAASASDVKHVVALRLTIGASTGRKVSGVTITVDGRAAGMTRAVTAMTGKGGVVVLQGLRVKHAGTLRVRAVKKGYRSAVLSLPVNG
jgi:hypothetical protein